MLAHAPAGTDFSLLGLWPTHEQDLVLRAALLKGEPALAAFRQWLEMVDVTANFDPATFRLLPLLYDNVRNFGLAHPMMSRLKGVYRYSWSRNQKLFDDLKPDIAALVNAGIPTLLIKGAPLVLSYYGNHALRPMSDIDVMVPADRVRSAIEVLEERGWRPWYDPTGDFLRFRHSVVLVGPAEREIDIHWHCLFETSGPGSERFLWSTARPLDFNGLPTLAASPAGELIVCILHGLRWNPEPPIRWIPDAVTILRNAAHEIDWDELVTFALERRLAYRLHLGLEYVHMRFNASVPAEVLARLSRARLSLVERVENTVVLYDSRRLFGPVGNLWLVFADYYRFAWQTNPIAFVVGFSHYLRFRWKLRSRLEIPGTIARGVMKRIIRIGHGLGLAKPRAGRQS